MKKIITFSLATLICAGVSAQDRDAKTSPVQKNTETKKEVEDSKPVTLDGKSYKISFTEKKAEISMNKSTVSGEGKMDNKTIITDKLYSVVDINSRIMLTFSDGNLLTPLFVSAGCPYKINTSGRDLVAFSSYCRLNSGNDKGSASQDTKLEIDASNAASRPVTDPAPDVNNAIQPMPVDETKQHLPPGTAKDDNAEMNITPPANSLPPSATPGKEIQRQTESPVQTNTGTMAMISGVVSGNSIQGTLSWTSEDGKRMSYSYSGSAASRKDINDTRVVGMK